MNTELGVLYPPGRMNSSAINSILNNLPWKVPESDSDWETWTQEMKIHAKTELGGNPTDEEVSEQIKPFFREFFEELMSSVGMQI